jgi:hypothetical protein
MLMAMSAAIIGLALAAIGLPWFSRLANRDLAGLMTLENGLAGLGAGVVVGLIVSLYPAWVAFRVRPAQVLAGRPDTESPSARRARQALSVIQIAAAMGLASFTLAVAWQTNFSMNDSPGFDPTPLLIFEMNEGRKLQEDDNTQGFVAEMRNHPAVAGITLASDAVGRTRNPWHKEFRREGGKPLMVEVKEVTPPFFEEYGIRPIAGRLFDPMLDHYDPVIPIVINEMAARYLGFASPQQAVGVTLKGRGAFLSDLDAEVVIGVAPEIRFRSLREPAVPIVYQLFSGGMTVTVRARGSVADAEAAVRSVWPKYFPRTELQMSSAKNIFAANYADDAALAKLLGLATLVAMFIAAIGAYVLATDAVQRRTREIALRKLFGARRHDVGRLVARELGAMLLIAALLALPLASLAIARYLAPFTERTPLAYWSTAVALIAALGVVGVAAARQARIAMATKPSAALRA